MYPFIMTMPLPVSSGKRLKLPKEQRERIKHIKGWLEMVDYKSNEETQCNLYVVDYSFPCHMRDYLD